MHDVRVASSASRVDFAKAHLAAGILLKAWWKTTEGYDTAVGAMHGLIEAGAGDKGHQLAPVLALLGDFIGNYDDAHHQPANVPPATVLRLVMEQDGLKQADLAEIGSQGVVSEVLSERRELNVVQIESLAERFAISPATFLEPAGQASPRF